MKDAKHVSRINPLSAKPLSEKSVFFVCKF